MFIYTYIILTILVALLIVHTMMKPRNLSNMAEAARGTGAGYSCSGYSPPVA